MGPTRMCVSVYICALTSIHAQEAGADKDVVTRTHSLALENSQRREELQVLNATRDTSSLHIEIPESFLS